LFHDTARVPTQLQGVFGIRAPGEPGVSLLHIMDGTSNTLAMGDAAGGTGYYRVRDLANPTQPAIDVLTGQPALIDQSWSAASVADPSHPWYRSIFALTAPYRLDPPPPPPPTNPP